jgi:hypothetical protein
MPDNSLRLNSGEVVVDLETKQYVLKPTINAWRTISRQYGGMAQARANLVAENVETMIFIIRIGSGLPDKQLRNLDEEVFKAGIKAETVLIPLLRYMGILANGGRPLPDDNNSLTDDNSLDTEGND